MWKGESFTPFYWWPYRPLFQPPALRGVWSIGLLIHWPKKSWSPGWFIQWGNALIWMSGRAEMQCAWPVFNLNYCPGEEKLWCHYWQLGGGINEVYWIKSDRKCCFGKQVVESFPHILMCPLCSPLLMLFLLYFSAHPFFLLFPPLPHSLISPLLSCRCQITWVSPPPSVNLSLSFFLLCSFPSGLAVMSKGQCVSSRLLCCQCSCLLWRYLLAVAFSCCPNELAALTLLQEEDYISQRL